MALELQQIEQNFETNGLPKELATNLTFEDEAGLTTYIEKLKGAMPKSINSFTPEELHELASKGEYKNLQSFADSIRQKAAKLKNENPKPAPTDEPEWAKTIRENQEKLQQQIETDKLEKEQLKKQSAFDDLFKKKSEGLDPFDIKMIKATLKADSTEKEMDEAIKEYKDHMVKRGINRFGTPGAGGQGASTADKVSKDYAEMRKKQREKLKKDK